MRQNSSKIWLRGCKPRVYKKHCGSLVGIDGSYFTPKEYTKFVKYWKTKKVGDKIFNVFQNRWETLKQIRYSWYDIDGTLNGKYLEITGLTDLGWVVYEPNAEQYELSEEAWKEFCAEWR